MTIETPSHKAAIAKCEELAVLVERHTNGKGNGVHATAISPLVLVRCDRGWLISDAEPPLIDCVTRLTKLLDTPEDISFLAPTIVREIYYRLLKGEQGEAIRQIATSGSNMQRIAEVIKRIKVDFTQPLRVEELAEQANMSAASFHRHFKAVTSSRSRLESLP